MLHWRARAIIPAKLPLFLMRAHFMLSVAVGKETHDNGPLLKLHALRSEVVVGSSYRTTTSKLVLHVVVFSLRLLTTTREALESHYGIPQNQGHFACKGDAWTPKH